MAAATKAEAAGTAAVPVTEVMESAAARETMTAATPVRTEAAEAILRGSLRSGCSGGLRGGSGGGLAAAGRGSPFTGCGYNSFRAGDTPSCFGSPATEEEFKT